MLEHEHLLLRHGILLLTIHIEHDSHALCVMLRELMHFHLLLLNGIKESRGTVWMKILGKILLLIISLMMLLYSVVLTIGEKEPR